MLLSLTFSKDETRNRFAPESNAEAGTEPIPQFLDELAPLDGAFKRIKQLNSKHWARSTHQNGEKKAQQIKLKTYLYVIKVAFQAMLSFSSREGSLNTPCHHNRDMTNNDVVINILSSQLLPAKDTRAQREENRLEHPLGKQMSF